MSIPTEPTLTEKERREQAAFKKLIERLGTTNDWKSIESRKPPEPDLLCVHRTDGAVAVECLSITNNDVAQRQKDGEKARTDALWTDDSPVEKLRKKLHKKYETTASRIDLLIYTDGQAILPDDVLRPTLEPWMNAVVPHPFAQAWWLGESEACLLWSSGNQPATKKTSGNPVAPRPHLLTILLGLLSPSLALVSLWISLRSLDTARIAVETSQRAYLIAELQPPTGMNTEEGKRHTLVGGTLSIQNLGNTQAIGIECDFTFSWTGVEHDSPCSKLNPLGPRQPVKVRYILTLPLTLPNSDYPKVCLVVRYRDVFGHQQEVDQICTASWGE